MRKPLDKSKIPRNDALYDVWSLVHIFTCIVLVMLFGVVPALVIATLWEPLEIFVLSPILAKFGILFGHESLGNSLADLGFNAIGIGIGWFFLGTL